jgi:hypothetical protein
VDGETSASGQLLSERQQPLALRRAATAWRFASRIRNIAFDVDIVAGQVLPPGHAAGELRDGRRLRTMGVGPS